MENTEEGAPLCGGGVDSDLNFHQRLDVEQSIFYRGKSTGP